MRNELKPVVLSLLLLALTMAVAPTGFSQGSSSPAAAPQAASPAASGARAEFLDNLDYYEQRFLRLAEAVPADKYSWRLNEGVRSISEIYLHVAAANFNLPKLLGTQPPAGFDAAKLQSSSMDKSQTIQTLKDSFAHMRGAAARLSDTDVDKPVKLLGKDSTYRGVFFFIVRHWGEQLGQAVAYGRMNGVVPPWTEEQQQQQKQPKPADKPKP
ncbi:MAG TPA: DinB family protein [Candidatus Acidoferrales bacterium]|nr:DinB family protein [Candidatus Acidoferrales bacterium]